MMTDDEKKAYRKAYYAANRDRLLAASKAWGVANPEKKQAIRKRYREKHPDRNTRNLTAEQRRIRNRASLLSRHGLTLEQYELMATAQNHSCLICDTESWAERNGLLHVDHDHATGRVRGLLCSRCNTGLGQFRDNLTFLQNAVSYLEKANALSADQAAD